MHTGYAIRRSFRRFVAVGTAFIFAMSNVAFSHSAEINIWSERHRAARPSLPLVATALPALAAMSSLSGRLKKIPAGTDNRPTVYYIQDVHLNAEAQSDISGVVSALVAEKSVALVAVEGAFGPINFGFFRHTFGAPALSMAADALLFDNEMPGSLHAVLTMPTAPDVVGIDDREAHAANAEAYRQSQKIKSAVKSDLDRERVRLNKAKRSLWSPTLQAFDARVERYQANGAAFGDYVTAVASQNRSSYPNTDHFLNALTLERHMDFRRVEIERGRLLSALAAKLTPAQTRLLVDLTVAYRTGELGHHEFYRRLALMCDNVHVRLDAFPRMKSYFVYVAESALIDGEALFSEVQRQEKERYRALAVTKPASDLVAAVRRLRLTGKLIEFALTRDEWNEYGPGGKGSLRSFENFYKTAELRDAKMTENFLKTVKGKASILITGGFHSEGITHRLEAAGYNVVSILPRLKTAGDKDGSAYLSVFAREKTPLEKLFEGKKLFLSPELNTRAFQTELTSGAAAATVLEKELPLKVEDPNGITVEASGTADAVEGVASNPVTGRSAAFSAHRVKDRARMKITFRDKTGFFERMIYGWAKSFKELPLSLNIPKFVHEHDIEWWLDWVVVIGGITLIWSAMIAAPITTIYFGHAALPFWMLAPLLFLSAPAGNIAMHLFLNTLLVPLSFLLPVKPLAIPVPQFGSSETDARELILGLARTVDKGCYGRILARTERMSASSSLRWTWLKNIDGISPELSEMFLLTFESGSHGIWKEISDVDPAAFGSIANRALTLYRRSDRPTKMNISLDLNGKTQEAIFNPSYTMEGLAGMMCYVSVQNGRIIFNALSDENLAFYLDCLVDYYLSEAIKTPSSRQRLAEHFFNLPTERIEKISARLSQTTRNEFSDLAKVKKQMETMTKIKWIWARPEYDDVQMSLFFMKQLIAQLPHESLPELGRLFAGTFEYGVWQGADPKLKNMADPGRALWFFRALASVDAEIAALLLLSMAGSHATWASFVSAKRGKFQLEPELFGSLLNLGLSRYRRGMPSHSELEPFQHPRISIEARFQEEKFTLALAPLSVGALFGEFEEEVAKKIISEVQDDQLPLLIESILEFGDFIGEYLPGSRDIAYSHLRQIPLSRINRIQRQMRPILKTRLKDIGIFSPQTLPANVEVPMMGNPGVSIGVLRFVDEESPSIEMLRKFGPKDIPAMGGLPTSESFGPCAGLVTTEDPSLTEHAQARALSWEAPHGIVPSLEVFRSLNGKVVVLEVALDNVVIREANEAEIKIYQRADFTKPPIEFPVVKETRKYVVQPGDPESADPNVVGYKVALLHLLSRKGIELKTPGVRVQIAEGPTIPLAAFRRLLGALPKASMKVFERSIQSLNPKKEYRDATLEEKLQTIRNTIGELDLEPVWDEFLKAGGKEILARGGFFRGLTNTDSLPAHPGVGAGMIATVPNVRDKPGFIDAVREVMSSAWVYNAYWERRSFHIIEAMVAPAVWIVASEPSDFAGVMRTSNVSRANNDELIVEFTPGQGIGSSLMTDNKLELQGRPARMVVNKGSRSVVEMKRGNVSHILRLDQSGGFTVEKPQSVLDFSALTLEDREKIASALVEIAEQTEMFFDRPQEIELVVKKDGADWLITLLQVRSVGKSNSDHKHDPAIAGLNRLLVLLFPFLFPLLLGSEGGDVRYLIGYYAIAAAWFFRSPLKRTAKALLDAYRSAAAHRPADVAEALNLGLSGAPLSVGVEAGPNGRTGEGIDSHALAAELRDGLRAPDPAHQERGQLMLNRRIRQSAA